jgi:hypothetical protein
VTGAEDRVENQPETCELFQCNRPDIVWKSCFFGEVIDFLPQDLSLTEEVKLIFGWNFYHCLQTSSSFYQRNKIGVGKRIDRVVAHISRSISISSLPLDGIQVIAYHSSLNHKGKLFTLSNCPEPQQTPLEGQNSKRLRSTIDNFLNVLSYEKKDGTHLNNLARNISEKTN